MIKQTREHNECAPPTTPTSSATFGTVKSDEMEFSSTKGDGAKRIVVCKKGSAPNCNGADGRTYRGR
jgi:hypothetical protein